MFPQLGGSLQNSVSTSVAEGGFVVGRFGGLHQCLSLPAGSSEEDVGGQT